MSKRDLEFLFEIGALRHQPRQWQRFLGIDFANISEHHFRVIWLALIIAAREKQGNAEKIMKMALAHDIAESRTGDVDYLARQYVVRKDDEAVKDIFSQTSLAKEFTVLIHEYEDRQSVEAKIVKDADNLDVDMELREQAARGVGLEADWQPIRAHIAKRRFYTKSGRELYDQIIKSNPNDWHINSPSNRFYSGDWKRRLKHDAR